MEGDILICFSYRKVYIRFLLLKQLGHGLPCSVVSFMWTFLLWRRSSSFILKICTVKEIRFLQVTLTHAKIVDVDLHWRKKAFKYIFVGFFVLFSFIIIWHAIDIIAELKA